MLTLEFGPPTDGDPFAAPRVRKDNVLEAERSAFLHPVLRLWEFPKPTIAQVHGYAAGGGSYWALIPDLIIALDDTEELVWRAAAISLRDLTGQNFGPKKGASDTERDKKRPQ